MRQRTTHTHTHIHKLRKSSIGRCKVGIKQIAGGMDSSGTKEDEKRPKFEMSKHPHRNGRVESESRRNGDLLLMRFVLCLAL